MLVAKTPATSTDNAALSESKPLTLAVCIATRGRPAILKDTLIDLAEQVEAPEGIFVAYTNPLDIGNAPEFFPHVRFVQGSPETSGSCAQRNRLLDAASTLFDLVFFMDDDFYLHREYLLRMRLLFQNDAEVLGATGNVIADGAKGPGLTGEFARSMLRTLPPLPSLAQEPPVSAFNTYGCNMAFRVAALLKHQIRFDEQLPAYAWYEDMDFSRRLLPYGKLMRAGSAQGVHLGVKVGRTSGKRFGYSQVANPLYLARKGTFPWGNALRSLARNMTANLAKYVLQEPYIDRRGRLHGNLLGLLDLVRGRLRPDRILELH